MKTSNSTIDITLHSAEKKYSSLMGEYWFFNADVITDVSIETDTDSVSFTAVLQAGQSHYYNDYSTPVAEIDYSDEFGCHPFIYTLWQFSEVDLEKLDDEDHASLNDLAGIKLSQQELVEIYLFLCDLRIEAQQKLNDEIEENGQALKAQHEKELSEELEEYEFMLDFGNDNE